MIYNLTIFNNFKIFPYRSPRKKAAILDLPHFWKLPKKREVTFIGFIIWRASRDYSIRKVPCICSFQVPACGPWTAMEPMLHACTLLIWWFIRDIFLLTDDIIKLLFLLLTIRKSYRQNLCQIFMCALGFISN